MWTWEVIAIVAAAVMLITSFILLSYIQDIMGDARQALSDALEHERAANAHNESALRHMNQAQTGFKEIQKIAGVVAQDLYMSKRQRKKAQLLLDEARQVFADSQLMRQAVFKTLGTEPDVEAETPETETYV
ncbi:hypothetical protein [Achromobacter phage Motura]|uniref:Uncharacterized protein n=1 Tax=Achromobacter phage Motura TaxID=2591403 RepID=A0A514CSX4_9CAUD|nr:hypothetical protein H1O15_gp215 [Achromobacter phage Motura]QDH83573.1 hypothetical protein [Achromobacter phage Motura]